MKILVLTLLAYGLGLLGLAVGLVRRRGRRPGRCGACNGCVLRDDRAKS